MTVSHDIAPCPCAVYRSHPVPTRAPLTWSRRVRRAVVRRAPTRGLDEVAEGFVEGVRLPASISYVCLAPPDRSVDPCGLGQGLVCGAGEKVGRLSASLTGARTLVHMVSSAF